VYRAKAAEEIASTGSGYSKPLGFRKKMRVALTIVHDVVGSESHAAARALARHAPVDFSVNTADLDGDILGVDAAPRGEDVSMVLLLSHAAAARVRAQLAKRRGPMLLATAFHAGWPDDLPEFYDAYQASDLLLVSNHDYRDRTGRLSSTVVTPWGFDEDARGASERARDVYAALRTAAGSAGAESIRPDLSEEVTVFVTSLGAPSYAACRELLRRQDCTFRLEVIEGVRPLSAALQQMLDGCRTPFYVQVDEDMLLYPEAVRTLSERISSAPPDVAIVVGQLYDVHLKRCIQGVGQPPRAHEG
jgi:hypothetical protein